ncbi:MAG: hypothetical protein HY940_05275 [Gammaproteobacteria bacterium]|nr:hypothetical protein [Gammaproteobacteria bacterium]
MHPLNKEHDSHPGAGGGLSGQLQSGDVYSQDQEVSLVDLWLVLSKRWRLFAIVWMLVGLAGLGFAMMQHRNYTYSTIIEPARQITGGIYTADVLSVKFKEYYIPAATRAHSQNTSDKEKRIKAEVRVPKNSDFIVLESVGPEKDQDAIRVMHESVVRIMTADQKQFIDTIHDGMIMTLAKEQLRLMELLGQEITPFATTMGGMRLKQGVTSAKQDKPPIVGEVEINLNNKIMTDHEREIAAQRQRINEIELQLRSLSPSHAVELAAKSPDPKGPGRRVIAGVSIMAGLVFGIFAVFIAEFLLKVKARRAELVD